MNSGTEHDWVSSDLLGERLEWQEEEPISELDVIDFQGHKFTTTRKVLLSWHSLKMKKTRQGWFRVMENATHFSTRSISRKSLLVLSVLVVPFKTTMFSKASTRQYSATGLSIPTSSESLLTSCEDNRPRFAVRVQKDW